MALCHQHPDRETELACDGCGRSFCESCLVGILGRTLCEECKFVAVKGVTAPRRRHPNATLVMVLPIVGYITHLALFTGPIGLYLGRKMLTEVSEDPNYTGRTLAMVGMMVSGASLVAWIVGAAAGLLVGIR